MSSPQTNCLLFRRLLNVLLAVLKIMSTRLVPRKAQETRPSGAVVEPLKRKKDAADAGVWKAAIGSTPAMTAPLRPLRVVSFDIGHPCNVRCCCYVARRAA